MDQELKAYLDDLKTSIVQDVKATMEERFAQQDEKIETTARQTQVLVEALHGRVELVAEWVTGFNQQLAAFQADTACRFEELRSELKPYYRNLNGRLSHLETEVPALERRVTALETRPSRRAGKKPPAQ